MDSIENLDKNRNYDLQKMWNKRMLREEQISQGGELGRKQGGLICILKCSFYHKSSNFS